jgi:CspA family cold shock protein
MTYSDQLVKCEECGTEFVYRIEEQRIQAEMGEDLEPPKKCPDCREKIELGPGLHAGVVKWYRDDKHFGFITQRDGSDIFFHRSSIDGDPEQFGENAQVWYEIGTSDRGPHAVNVHLRE